METLTLLLEGIGLFTGPVPFLLVVAGVIWGILIGAIPGLSTPLALLLLLPFVFALPVTDGLILLAATYCGGTFGGAFSSILLNIPGTSESVCTAFDGHPMARQGKARKALQASITVSALGGILGALIFIIGGPFLARIALGFSDGDYFGVIVMGILVIGAISGKSLIKGLMSAVFGFLLGTVGIAVTSGLPRFTFGSLQLQAGIEFVIVMIGLFGLGEVFSRYGSIREGGQPAGVLQFSGEGFRLKELLDHKVNIVRSWLLGTFAGIVPGIGATLASFLAYGTAKSLSKKPHEFGQGTLEGVIAPETANNAATGGAMVPLFCLGIPGGASTAVMLAAFLFSGLQPGPLLFTQQAPLVGAIMTALIVSNLAAFLLGRYGASLFARVLRLNFAYIVTAVMVFSFIGAYSLRNLMIDTYILVAAGVIGYFWKKHDFPLAPLVLALVLGTMAEYRFINALSQHGDVVSIVTRPVVIIALVIGAAFMVPPIIKGIKDIFVKRPTDEDAVRLNLVSPFIYLGLIGASVYLWHVADSWPEWGYVATWPRIVLGSLLILSILSIVKWLSDYKNAKKAGDGINWVPMKSYFVPEGPYVFILMAVVAGYIALQAMVGFVILTLGFCTVMLYITHVKHPLKISGFSIILTVLVSIVFIGLLQQIYPPGVGLFRDFHFWLYDKLMGLM